CTPTKSDGDNGDGGVHGRTHAEIAKIAKYFRHFASRALRPLREYVCDSQYKRYLARSRRQRASAPLQDAAIAAGSSPVLRRAMASFEPISFTPWSTSYFEG